MEKKVFAFSDLLFNEETVISRSVFLSLHPPPDGTAEDHALGRVPAKSEKKVIYRVVNWENTKFLLRKEK